MTTSYDMKPVFDVQEFEQSGFAILRQFAPQDLVERMLRAVHRDLQYLREPLEFEADVNYPGSPTSRDSPGGKTVRRLRQALSRDPIFQEWVSYPPLVSVLTKLLGSPVSCPLAHHNCVMTKHPRFSSETEWHRDIRFWSYASGELVNAWLALGKESIENGCLQVIPGSHRMEIGPDRLDDRKFLDRNHPENAPLFDSIKPVELEPGDLLLFHAKTFHAANRNQTCNTKFSAVFTFHGPENHALPESRSAQFPELILPEVSDET